MHHSESNWPYNYILKWYSVHYHTHISILYESKDIKSRMPCGKPLCTYLSNVLSSIHRIMIQIWKWLVWNDIWPRLLRLEIRKKTIINVANLMNIPMSNRQRIPCSDTDFLLHCYCHGPLARWRKIAGSACAGNVRNVFPATNFKGHR